VSLCAVNPTCDVHAAQNAVQSVRDTVRTAQDFASDPGGHVRAVARDLSDTIGRFNTKVQSGDAFGVGWDSGHAFGDTEAYGLSAIYAGRTLAGLPARISAAGGLRAAAAGSVDAIRSFRLSNLIRIGYSDVPPFRTGLPDPIRKFGIKYGTADNYRGPGTRFPFHGHIFLDNLLRPWDWPDIPKPKLPGKN
jgi:hypothetical protein